MSNPYLEIYASFSRNLRGWLIAFGVGAPVLLVSQESVATRLSASPRFEFIVWTFFVGLTSQILAVFFYKMTLGGLYLGEEGQYSKDGRWWKFCYWSYRQQWLELIPDVVTLVAYAVAVYMVVVALA